MSDTSAATPTPITYESELPAREHRSFLRKAIDDTFGQFGARIGSAWIVVMIVLAVIAPYVASSFPILMKADGKWSSPMWKSLTPVDVTLTACAAAFVVLWFVRKASFGQVLVGLLIVVAIVGPAAYLFKKPPESVNWQMYRDMERQGRAQVMIRTLIPYSPTDRLRDMPEARLTPPSRYHWLGTESDGADLLSRMVHATRIALSIGLISNRWHHCRRIDGIFRWKARSDRHAADRDL
jgi:peptide/nickel transport system permease protein